MRNQVSNPDKSWVFTINLKTNQGDRPEKKIRVDATPYFFFKLRPKRISGRSTFLEFQNSAHILEKTFNQQRPRKQLNSW